jgi:hypothetical protein
MMENKSLSAGMASYEKEKIINLLKTLNLQKSQIDIFTLSKILGIKIEFMLAPLKYLADRDLIFLKKEINKKEKIEDFKTEITESGKTFIEAIEFLKD